MKAEEEGKLLVQACNSWAGCVIPGWTTAGWIGVCVVGDIGATGGDFTVNVGKLAADIVPYKWSISLSPVLGRVESTGGL